MAVVIFKISLLFNWLELFTIHLSGSFIIKIEISIIFALFTQKILIFLIFQRLQTSTIFSLGLILTLYILILLLILLKNKCLRIHCRNRYIYFLPCILSNAYHGKSIFLRHEKLIALRCFLLRLLLNLTVFWIVLNWLFWTHQNGFSYSWRLDCSEW